MKLEGQVAQALKKIRRDEAYRDAVAAHEKRTATLGQRVEIWSDWLELDDYQRDQLSGFMRVRDTREREYLDAWEKGASRETLDEMRRGYEREFIRSLRGAVTPAQAETLNEKFGDEETETEDR